MDLAQFAKMGQPTRLCDRFRAMPRLLHACGVFPTEDTEQMTEHQRSGVQLSDLIDEGILCVPATIFFDFKGQRFEAILEDSKTISAEGRAFSSLSVAAGSVVTARMGLKSANRSYFACNGWRFWHVRTADGDDVSLFVLRERMRQSSRQTADDQNFQKSEGRK